jgi:hypothetical protein
MNKHWCSYCKGEIKEKEDFAVINGKCYHISCAKQMNNYYDPFSPEGNEWIFPQDVLDDYLETGDL